MRAQRTVLRIRGRIDPHHFGNLDSHPDPHPHQIKIRIRIRIHIKVDPEPDPHPHQFADDKPKCMEYEQGRTQEFARGDAHFWLTYPLPPRIWIWIRIRIRIKILSSIRIRIKTMRIHSTGLYCFFLYFCIT
jgi:hypothetical protein